MTLCITFPDIQQELCKETIAAKLAMDVPRQKKEGLAKCKASSSLVTPTDAVWKRDKMIYWM
jgi:hypothetical protein